ncbi:MAG: hypothetical protein PWQ63_927 [Methanolobus sp.]|jgi:alkylhydroperoxidase/carboxymuconolactone decarboxylase family protein YurZ|nr:hypothetical protein [Methanolobus sp.]
MKKGSMGDQAIDRKIKELLAISSTLATDSDKCVL